MVREFYRYVQQHGESLLMCAESHRTIDESLFRVQLEKISGTYSGVFCRTGWRCLSMLTAAPTSEVETAISAACQLSEGQQWCFVGTQVMHSEEIESAFHETGWRSSKWLTCPERVSSQNGYEVESLQISPNPLGPNHPGGFFVFRA